MFVRRWRPGRKGYRVFVGSWDDGDPDWTHHDDTFDTWAGAVAAMSKHLGIYAGDDCSACRLDAAEAVARLVVAEPGEFEAGVDGDDCMIIPVNREAPRVPFVADARTFDIPETIAAAIRGAASHPCCVGITLRPYGARMVKVAERQARLCGIRILWVPAGRAITGRN